MTILFFGDSITWGAWDEQGGWVARIKKFVDKKVIDTNFSYYHDVYNIGISGDKTSDLLERFDFETQQRLNEEEETVFVFAIGINDSQFVDNQGNVTPIDEFKINIENLITKAKKYSNKIIFVGLIPVDDSKLTLTSWESDKSYKLEYVSQYNKIIEQICQSKHVHFINLYDEFLNKNYKELLIDGLHPNSEGHKQISEKVLKFLQEKKFI